MEKNADYILETLEKMYPDAKSELNFSSVFELLVAVVLSAQCTDKRVNQVTKHLFEIANTPQAMAQLSIETIEQIVFPCGFYKHKAKFLKQLSMDILQNFDGQVPDNVQQLTQLPGVGKKTANVVFAVGFGGQAIAVDTHVFRVSNRLAIAEGDTVEKVESGLQKVVPQNAWSKSHHLLLLFGRYVCKSQNPNCCNCQFVKFCKYYRGGSKNGQDS